MASHFRRRASGLGLVGVLKIVGRGIPPRRQLIHVFAKTSRSDLDVAHSAGQLLSLGMGTEGFRVRSRRRSCLPGRVLGKRGRRKPKLPQAIVHEAAVCEMHVHHQQTLVYSGLARRSLEVCLQIGDALTMGIEISGSIRLRSLVPLSIGK